jgi:hypothetical protein
MDTSARRLECRHRGWRRRRQVCRSLPWGLAYSHSNSSNLTFLLEPGWLFVETEDWRADIEAEWSQVGADDCEHDPAFFSATRVYSIYDSGMGLYQRRVA